MDIEFEIDKMTKKQARDWIQTYIANGWVTHPNTARALYAKAERPLPPHLMHVEPTAEEIELGRQIAGKLFQVE